MIRVKKLKIYMSQQLMRWWDLVVMILKINKNKTWDYNINLNLQQKDR